MNKVLWMFLSILLTIPVWANDKLSRVLQEYAWEKRQLIVFTPGNENPQYQLFLKVKEEFRDEFNDRKLQVWHVIAGQEIKLNEQKRSDLTSNDFQDLFEVGGNEFSVLLIGYDQQEKLRQNKMDIDFIFSEIDQMPIRIQEMQEDVN